MSGFKTPGDLRKVMTEQDIAKCFMQYMMELASGAYPEQTAEAAGME